ncbi:hypothetical protein MMC30_008337 [Trapelia coarctata]|nr:hypothetical protein [Trapelia coarctata]
MDTKPKVVPVKFSMPARSNTHPVWAKDPSRKPKHPEPFDPHELYRRLEKYQQSLVRTEERRKAKAAKTEKQKPPPTPEKYRHVPKNAASQFVNTASPEFVDAHQRFHPLSRLMLRAPRPSEPQTLKTDFMTPRDLELGVPKKQREKLGIATVDLGSIDEVTECSLAAEREAIAKHPNDKRNDWAQRDDRLESERRFFHIFSRRNKRSNTPPPEKKDSRRKSTLLAF